jgi:hypothetical protein
MNLALIVNIIVDPGSETGRGVRNNLQNKNCNI